MTKAPKYSRVASELKKEYLREHLESIKDLIRLWMSELHLPEPLAPHDRVWGWQTLYRSPRQDNPDDNHMLRRHLRSRALWSHHSSWERVLGENWRLTEQLRLEAKIEKEKQSSKVSWKYTEDYVSVALWKAFDTALGKVINLPFSFPHDRPGFTYGAYLIEESADTSEVRILIEKEFRRFILFLSQTSTMRQLTQVWLEANRLETLITALADKALKSNDIFYQCRFCRHLWA